MTERELLNSNMKNVEQDGKTKEDYIIDFIKGMNALDEAIEPFKDQKKSLKKSYEENNWLSKEEMKMATKAMKMLKDDMDIEQLMDYYDTIRVKTGVR